VLTCIARHAGQVLILNTSQAVVLEAVGPGAVWPQLTSEMVAKNVWLEVEAGGDGLPNKQQEVANMTQLVPLLQRIPGISPEWLAKQIIQRMGADIDLSEAFAEGTPSMEALNQLMSKPPGVPGQEGQGPPGEGAGSGAGRGPPRPAAPGQDPNAQGPQGLTNATANPPGPLGPRVPPMQVFGANGNRPGTGGGMPRIRPGGGFPTP
jgi:hypothetical protein